jgi:hypothetical protein
MKLLHYNLFQKIEAVEVLLNSFLWDQHYCNTIGHYKKGKKRSIFLLNMCTKILTKALGNWTKIFLISINCNQVGFILCLGNWFNKPKSIAVTKYIKQLMHRYNSKSTENKVPVSKLDYIKSEFLDNLWENQHSEETAYGMGENICKPCTIYWVNTQNIIRSHGTQYQKNKKTNNHWSPLTLSKFFKFVH